MMPGEVMLTQFLPAFGTTVKKKKVMYLIAFKPLLQSTYLKICLRTVEIV